MAVPPQLVKSGPPATFSRISLKDHANRRAIDNIRTVAACEAGCVVKKNDVVQQARADVTQP